MSRRPRMTHKLRTNGEKTVTTSSPLSFRSSSASSLSSSSKSRSPNVATLFRLATHANRRRPITSPELRDLEQTLGISEDDWCLAIRSWKLGCRDQAAASEHLSHVRDSFQKLAC